MQRLRVAQFDAEPVQSPHFTVAVLHHVQYLVTVATHSDAECRDQLGLKMLPAETHRADCRHQSRCSKNCSDEAFLRAKQVQPAQMTAKRPWILQHD